MIKKISKVILVIIGVFFINIFSVYAAETMNIDYPTTNQQVANTVTIQGWVMSTQSGTTVKAYVDNKEVNLTFVKRQDVYRIIKGYGTEKENPNNGFKGSYDISNLNYGNHTLKIDILDSTGKVIKTATRNFIHQAPKTTLHIDYPTTNQQVANTVTIQGWIMSIEKNKTIKAYVDGVEVPLTLSKRTDVYKTIKGYGGESENPNNGFKGNYEISKLNYGNHTLKVDVLDNTGKIMKSMTRNFVHQAPKTTLHIDYPTTNQQVANTVTIQGWMMSTEKNKTIKAYVDGVEVPLTLSKRTDVYKAIKGYGGEKENPNNGFKGSYEISKLNYGNHTLKVDVLDSTGKIMKSMSRNFVHQKPKTTMCIDYPTTNQQVANSVTIKGWTMSAATNQVRIYVDNTKVNTVKRTSRPDVLKAIKGYGDSKTNPQPGYEVVYDITNLKYGNHTVKVEVADSLGRVLSYSTRTFIKKKPESLINIDYPTSNTVNLNLEIRGWYIVKEKNTHVEIYVDNNKVTNITPQKRADVMKIYTAYNSYMENSNPGYLSTYNTANLKDGTHTVTVKIINDNNKEIVSSKSKTFTLQKYRGKINIDYPQLSNINSNFDLIGWEMSELDNSYLKLFIDGKEKGVSFTRTERNDVIKAVTNYGSAAVNATPGFQTSVNITGLSEGNHTLTLKLYSKLNELIATENKKILIYKNRYNGIDVSSHNTVSSWTQVKQSGIDYAFIRAAVRGYGINNQGINGNLVEDSKFKNFVNGATASNIKVGAYVYSQAINNIEAVQEANMLIKKVTEVGGKNKVKLPLVIDTEFSSCPNRCGRADNLTKQQRTDIVKNMANTIKSAGYTPMIYASTSFLNDQLDMGQLKDYDVWVAHYGVSQPTYKGPYKVWQYTSTGQIAGVSGVVDLNYFYVKY